MRRRALTLATLAAATSLVILPSSSAASSLSFVGCPSATGFECTSEPVPLDRAGTAAGTISLSVERRLAGIGPSRDAVIALAGGPGQAALPLGEFIAQTIAPALGSRDLLIFDQRGTGASDPLSCAALETFSTKPASQLFEQCAQELGPARGAFTTQESVEDIEALRVAGGYEKLVLYGTSYGTKVALEYAERYPQDVEALVLDSVVPTDGPEPLAIPSFEAIPGMLEELCANDACAGITSNPVADIASLAAQLSRRALSGSVYDGAGKRHASTLNALGLLGILEAGDLNPALRALLPAAVRSALAHDPDPLLRLHLLSEGLIPNVPIEEGTSGEASSEIDEALFVATSCEEQPFPWQRAAPASTRLAEALSFLHAQPAGDFYPFDAVTSYANSLVPACAGWPDASAPPPAPSALADLPTLILSGEQDLRTPTADARAVAALIPDAQLLLVPYTGHSVLGSDLSGCAALAVKAFFAGRAGGSQIQPCAATSDPLAPTPITPTKLAHVQPPASFAGKSGRTLVAVLDTLVDLNRQLIAATLQANAELPSGSSFGGLRGGYAKLTRTKAILKDFSLVPGVRLTATFPVRNGELQTSDIHVSGSASSPGIVRFGGSSERVSGTLAGRRFDISLAKVRLSRVRPRASSPQGEWPAAAALQELLKHRRPAAARSHQAQPRLQPTLLSWLP